MASGIRILRGMPTDSFYVRFLLAALFALCLGCQAEQSTASSSKAQPREEPAQEFEENTQSATLESVFDLFPAEIPLKADQVQVYKASRRMDLMWEGERIRSYRISLGGNPLGHKQREGDSRTPEGEYIIDWRNPKSRFHLSLHISYPNREDRSRAAKEGVSPGGDIMIHGLPNGWEAAGPALAGVDWTDGCIAVDNWAIREIWDAVPNGTPITILP